MSVQLSSNTYTQHTNVVRACATEMLSVCVHRCFKLLERASTSTMGMVWICARVCTLSVDEYHMCVCVCSGVV